MTWNHCSAAPTAPQREGGAPVPPMGRPPLLSWIPICPQSFHGLLLAYTQPMARGQTSAPPAASPATNLQDLRSSLQLMDKLQHQILEDTEPFRSSVALQPVSYQLDKEGEHFGLTLDTQGFSQEELSVRPVGRKLRVSGKTEKKEENGRDSYSYRLQEFRQEFDLPEGVNPDNVNCYLSPDGKLHIQTAKVPCVEPAERELTIKRSSEEETQQSVFTSRRQPIRDRQQIIEQTCKQGLTNMLMCQ